MDKTLLIDNDALYGAIVETLEEGYKVSVTITGMSMWPFLCHGRDSVILSKVDSNRSKAGDIILFRIPQYNKYMIHRIIKINTKENLVLTAGDGNLFYDGWYPVSDVIAKVDSINRKNKEYRVNSFGFKVVSYLWTCLFPFRRYLLRLLKVFSRLKFVKV